jgi:hypothetical protein
MIIATIVVSGHWDTRVEFLEKFNHKKQTSADVKTIPLMQHFSHGRCLLTSHFEFHPRTHTARILSFSVSFLGSSSRGLPLTLPTLRASL